MEHSKKQLEYIRQATHRWNLKVGAVRSGKSFVDVSFIIPYRLRMLQNESGLAVIMGVSRESIERNVLQPMREIYTSALIGQITSRNTARICGSDVYCLGAEKVTQVAKIQGASIKYCYGDEIAKWNKEVWEMLKSRLDKPYSCFDGACNPENPGHWLKEFIDNPEIDAYIQKYKIFDNPFLSQEFVNNLCKEYEGTVYYKRYILGEWAMAEGLIYPMYEQAFGLPQDDDVLEYCLSMDYGTLNAFAALLWEKHRDGIWYATKGYYYSGRDTGVQKTDEEYAEEIDKLTAHIKYVTEVIIDPSAASFITLLRKKPKYRVRQANNAVLDGIRETAGAIKSDRIKISPDLTDWKKEVEGYVWDESNQSEDKPIKINDHYMDATRYFVKTKRINTTLSGYKPILA